MRTTQKDLQQAVDRLNTRFPRHDEYHYAIEWAYNRPSMVLENSKSCTRHFLPRVQSGQLLALINAFAEGLEEMDRVWRARIKNDDDLVFEVRKAGL